MEIIATQIKQLYGSKAAFCESQNYGYTNFASRLKSIFNAIDKVNKFLKPLKLRVEIVDLESEV